LLKTLRHWHGIKQMQVLTHLPSWTQTTFSRLETGEMAPAFDQLAPIYTALRLAGVELTSQDRQQYLTLARTRIEAKKTYLEHKTNQEWDELRLSLSQLDHDTQTTAQPLERFPVRAGLLETRHLVGREDWLASVIASIHSGLPKKLVVLQGPTGIGKSSELHRIALHFLSTEPPRPHVVLCVFPSLEHQSEPENALDLLLGSLLVEVGPPDAAMQGSALKMRIAYALSCLQKMPRPLVVLVDNAEHLLQTDGQLAACWEQFLKHFLSSQHHASLVLATKEWPDWYKGEQLFVAERRIPSLTVEEGVGVLQRLGLASVPLEYLEQMSEAVGGIPLCLEWAASLALKPLWLDSWDELDDLIDQEEGSTEATLTRRVVRLLEDRALFGGDVASRLTPMLERIIDTRLSAAAVEILHILSLATLPLGKLPLQRLCPHPSLLKEQRTVSLLTAHAQRVQVLPMVAAVVSSRLSPQQRQQIEEQLIDAYLHWLDDGELSDREMGAIIGELATLYLKRHRLLDAAQLLIIYGWMSYNLGYGPRLARLAQKTMQHGEWKLTPESECGGLLLYYILTPFLGQAVDAEKRAADFQHILALADKGNVSFQPATEMHPIRLLMSYHMNHQRFEEAQAVLDAGAARLEPYQHLQIDVQASLLAHRALLLAGWSNYLEEQEKLESVSSMRKEVITLYWQCCTLLSIAHEASPLKSRLLKKRLSAYSNYLGEYLTRNGQAEEALEFLEQSIELGEQGYCNFGALAAAYGDMSQALMELGRLEEALLFDEKAMAEVQRCAQSGDALSQDEVWIYRVNRGRLYLRLGRIDEAEQLLREAEPHIHLRRSVYRLFAKRALKEIEQLRGQAPSQQEVGDNPD